MAELRQHLGLTDEALARAVGLGAQDLQRDRVARLPVVGPEHLAHPARPRQAFDRETPGENPTRLHCPGYSDNGATGSSRLRITRGA